MKFDLFSEPARIVASVYAFWSAYGLFWILVSLLHIIFSIPSALFSVVLFPFYLTVFVPFISLGAMASNHFSFALPEPFGFLFFLSCVALIFFYPVVAWFLWYKYRVAWVLAFAMSLATAVGDVYVASAIGVGIASAIGIGLFPFVILAAAFNFLLAYLLWRSKTGFFAERTVE